MVTPRDQPQTRPSPSRHLNHRPRSQAGLTQPVQPMWSGGGAGVSGGYVSTRVDHPVVSDPEVTDDAPDSPGASGNTPVTAVAANDAPPQPQQLRPPRPVFVPVNEAERIIHTCATSGFADWDQIRPLLETRMSEVCGTQTLGLLFKEACAAIALDSAHGRFTVFTAILAVVVVVCRWCFCAIILSGFRLFQPRETRSNDCLRVSNSR